jgi:hypothetical protein
VKNQNALHIEGHVRMLDVVAVDRVQRLEVIFDGGT